MGRTQGHRNTPSLLDAAQWRWLGWDGAHDSLWAASLTPLLSDGEMQQTVNGAGAARARRPRSRRGLPRGLSGAAARGRQRRWWSNLGKALAAYQSHPGLRAHPV